MNHTCEELPPQISYEITFKCINLIFLNILKSLEDYLQSFYCHYFHIAK